MKKLSAIGRMIFAIPFAIFGINHFIMYDYYLGILTSFIPLGGYLVIFTGFILIITSISIILKKYTFISTITLSFLILLFIIFIHIPQIITRESIEISINSLFKDFSLLGASLYMAGISYDYDH